ncbi:cytochrome c1 [Parablastomonas sp. CN1-191]|uniref:cytochrome c1 n=1 Tax=Parablastomonas sp. CN1-191 TaxID=3400908 RepID=UPI003BF85C53
MIRILSIFGGLFFALALLWSFGKGAYSAATEPVPQSAEKALHKHPKELELASNGPLGHFDRQQLQRGFAVYEQVCSNCHSLGYVSYRDLAALGYDQDEVKAIAAKATVNAVDPLTGEAKDRPGTPSDKFPPVVYAGTGHPPDLSLITKARHDGPAYVYSLLTGYAAQTPAMLAKHPEAKTGEGLYYNPYFANLNIAMPPPLTSDGQVTYSDGTPATIDQMAKDVAAFLVWTAEPKLDKRHQTGLAVLGFLLFATILAYMAKRQVWGDLAH